MKGKPKSCLLFPERNVSRIWCLSSQSSSRSYTQRCTSTHRHTQLHRPTQICTLRHPQTQPQTQLHSHMRSQKHIQAHRDLDAHTLTHSGAHKGTQLPPHIRFIDTESHRTTGTETRAHTPDHRYANTHVYIVLKYGIKPFRLIAASLSRAVYFKTWEII